MIEQAMSGFARLVDYERRSLAHDTAQAGRRKQDSTWDGVVFRLGDHHLAVAIDQVEEVVACPSFTPVPGAKEWLLGLANVRGNLMTMVDLGWMLFGTRTPVTARTRLILTRVQGRLTGLVVDEVFGQRHFHSDDLSEDARWTDTALDGLVQAGFSQGGEHWGVFRLDYLVRRPSFLDGAA